jgi:hypothetical protein
MPSPGTKLPPKAKPAPGPAPTKAPWPHPGTEEAFEVVVRGASARPPVARRRDGLLALAAMARLIT